MDAVAGLEALKLEAGRRNQDIEKVNEQLQSLNEQLKSASGEKEMVLLKSQAALQQKNAALQQQKVLLMQQQAAAEGGTGAAEAGTSSAGARGGAAAGVSEERVHQLLKEGMQRMQEGLLSLINSRLEQRTGRSGLPTILEAKEIDDGFAKLIEA